MTTFPITLPNDGGPAKVTIRDVNVVGVTSAPFSLAEQIQEFDGQVWEFDLAFPPMKPSRGAIWTAALRSLRGPVGTFYFRPPRYERRGTIASGVVQVDGAGQTGLTLNVKTGGGVVADAFKAGDLFSLGSGANIHLHTILEDAATDGAGKAALTIWPRLRAVPADSAPLELAEPLGLFRLVNRGVEVDWDEVGNVLIAVTPIREAF